MIFSAPKSLLQEVANTEQHQDMIFRLTICRVLRFKHVQTPRKEFGVPIQLSIYLIICHKSYILSCYPPIKIRMHPPQRSWQWGSFHHHASSVEDLQRLQATGRGDNMGAVPEKSRDSNDLSCCVALCYLLLFILGASRWIFEPELSQSFRVIVVNRSWIFWSFRWRIPPNGSKWTIIWSEIYHDLPYNLPKVSVTTPHSGACMQGSKECRWIWNFYWGILGILLVTSGISSASSWRLWMPCFMSTCHINVLYQKIGNTSVPVWTAPCILWEVFKKWKLPMLTGKPIWKVLSVLAKSGLFVCSDIVKAWFGKVHATPSIVL